MLKNKIVSFTNNEQEFGQTSPRSVLVNLTLEDDLEIEVKEALLCLRFPLYRSLGESPSKRFKVFDNNSLNKLQKNNLVLDYAWFLDENSTVLDKTFAAFLDVFKKKQINN